MSRATTPAVLLIGLAGCGRSDRGPASSPVNSTLTIGFGLSSGANAGIEQAVRTIALEGLVSFSGSARPQPWLAESLTGAPDGLSWRIRLRKNARFHDGSPVAATRVRDALKASLPQNVGPAYADIADIEAISDQEIEIRLKRRSTFVIEGLDALIQGPSATIGTGAFAASKSAGGEIEMVANDSYHGGKPLVSRIVFRQYASVRSAWADMLRGGVDMLFDVGLDALDSLESSSKTKVFTFPRPFQYVVVLNSQRGPTRNKSLRQLLSRAVDREALIRDGLGGHGRASKGPVWPDHWASDPSAPTFTYDPAPIASAGPRPRLVCLFSDPNHERLVLLLQRMLASVGVDLALEHVPIDRALKRVQAGDFDAWLVDAAQGPALLRSYWFWHSEGPYNLGHYRNPDVDAALDAIRGAPNDEAYKAGVSAFQRAIVDDPPAIFLAWSERARAVSTRFEVPTETGRDILGTLRAWRPVSNPGTARIN